MLSNVALVSTAQQSESAICIHIYPLFWISFPFRSAQSFEQSSLSYTVGSHELSILYVVSIVCMCQSYLLETSIIAQLVKNLPAMQETSVQFLGQKDLLEKG